MGSLTINNKNPPPYKVVAEVTPSIGNPFKVKYQQEVSILVRINGNGGYEYVWFNPRGSIMQALVSSPLITKGEFLGYLENGESFTYTS